MATIEERARQHALAAVYGDKNDALYKDIETECIKLATEQDHIARADERERCIKIFREWYCKITCNHICDIKQMCTTAAEIRKALEEGEQ